MLFCYRRNVRNDVVPRHYLTDAKSLSGVNNPGVYFLVNDEAGSLTKLYIGQTRNGITRLDDHNAKKDFWNKAILFLADGDHFTLNILSGLEKYAIQKALDANRYDVDNKAVHSAYLHQRKGHPIGCPFHFTRLHENDPNPL